VDEGVATRGGTGSVKLVGSDWEPNTDADVGAAGLLTELAEPDGLGTAAVVVVTRGGTILGLVVAAM
jgi:hypothetical protein